MLLAVVVRLDKKTVDTAPALITLVLRVFVLKIGAWTVSALISPELIKLVLRNPVLIGSKELLMIPPLVILMPPFTLIVDAFRVEGIPATVWGNATPFIDDTEILAELMLLVLMVFVLRARVFTPPLKVARPPTSKVLPNCVGSWTKRFPEPTVMPPLTTDIPPDTIREPFVIVWPPLTETVDSKMDEGSVAGAG